MNEYLKIPKKLQLFKKTIIFDCETFLHRVSFVDGKTTAIVKHEPYLVCAKFKKSYDDPGYFKDYPKFKSNKFLYTFNNDILKFLNKSRELTLIAHNILYDFIVCKLYYSFISAGFTISIFSDSNPFFIIFERPYPYGKGKQKITIQDNLNYFTTSLASASKLVDCPKWDDFDYKDESIENQQRAIKYCRNDVEIIDRLITYLCEFLKKNYSYNCLGGSGNFLTISGLTYKLYMLQNEPLINKSRPESIKLERESYGGGRTECFRIGTFTNLDYIDINSLYPSVMYNNKIPYAYYDTNLPLTLSNLEQYSAIARVYIYNITNDNRFIGKNIGGRFCFPYGSFEATLCTGELRKLLTDNIKFDLLQIQWYHDSYFLKDNIEYLYNKRLESKDTIEKEMFKKLMNCLYGKFGQYLKTYKKIEESDEIYSCNEEIDNVKCFVKCLGGGKFVKETNSISNNTACYIASHITSYARLTLWNYIKIIGYENIYYCDTDSIIYNRDFKHKIEQYIDKTKLGYFKIEYENLTMVIRGLKDYKINDEEDKIKGVKKHSKKIDENTYEVEQWNKLNYYIKDKQFKNYKGRIYKKSLTREYTKGIIENDIVRGLELDER